MIRWIRTAEIAQGKHQETVQWAKDLREYTKKIFEGGSDVKIFLETLGDYGVICWMVTLRTWHHLSWQGKY